MPSKFKNTTGKPRTAKPSTNLLHTTLAQESQNPGKYYYRAMRMLELKITNNTNKAIAKRFNVGEEVVKKSLNFAMDQGVIQALEAKIINELVPQAIEVYREALNKPGSERVGVAKDLLTKLFAVGTRQSKTQQHHETLGLRAYLDAKRTSFLPHPPDDPNNRPTAFPGEIIEAHPEETWETAGGTEPQGIQSPLEPEGTSQPSFSFDSDELEKPPTVEQSADKG